MKTVVKQHLRKGKIVKAHKRACGNKKLLGAVVKQNMRRSKKSGPMIQRTSYKSVMDVNEKPDRKK